MHLSHAAARIFRYALAASLAVSALLYVPFTWHWPLVGDASLIHYIAFLIERGWAPYRQLGDMNMPGSFLIELGAMHLFGPGALAWRLFDFGIVFAAAAALFAICGRRHWLPALFASSLFLLIHGRDGLAQGGQRDLTMAVFLLAATACLLLVIRRGSLAGAIGFGLLSGLAVSIKPTALLLTLLQLAVVWRFPRYGGKQTAKPAARVWLAGGLGWLAAPAACLVFLLREHALGAFLNGLHTVVPYYASLGHRPLGYILTHSLSPVEPLVALWLAVVLLRRGPLDAYMDLARSLLLAGVLFGLVNCVLQHRALPYYRYPLLAFLLPLIGLDLAEALFGGAGIPPDPERPRAPQRQLARGLAAAALAFGGLFLPAQSAVLIHRYRWNQTDMLNSLQRNLGALGGPALSGRIQCIDSVSGCGTVLYRMRLEPATGVLSDFLLFGNTTDSHAPEDVPVIRDTRAQFLNAVAARLPEVMVVTSHLHMTGPEDFGKLARWPALAQILATRYSLATEWRPTRPERWWSREEYPASYRVYVLKPPQAGLPR
jgi:hypothetical protein